MKPWQISIASFGLQLLDWLQQYTFPTEQKFAEREHADKIFAVTINGAQRGVKTWPELIQPLDKGDFDNRELLKTLREIGYRGPIGLMCYGIPGDVREHLVRSMGVWKTWEAEWTRK